MTSRLWGIHLESMQIYFFEFQCCQSTNSSRCHRNRLSFPEYLKVNMYLGFTCFTVTLRGSSWDQNFFFFFFHKKWKSVPLRVYNLSMGIPNKIIIIVPFSCRDNIKTWKSTETLLGVSMHWCAFMDMPAHPPTQLSSPQGDWGSMR